MRDSNQILNKFREQGYRLTRARKFILDFFLENSAPLSSLDLQKAFSRKKMAINKTTVYRELAFLKEEKIIRELQIGDNIKRYEIMPDSRHHHIVCVNCKKVECVELKKNIDTQKKAVAKDKKFKIINFSLEFFGLCAKCR